MTKSQLSFRVIDRDPGSNARNGELVTRRGVVETPIFMPVGTQATVRGMTVEDLQSCKARILLANTYHLILRPGVEVFKHFGGIHQFMKWPGPVLTDSGGFQIFSLPNNRKMTEEGAVFLSHIDGKKIHLSPESSIAAQRAINSDIMMVLDECVPSTSPHDIAKSAMELTHRWAVRSLNARGDSDQALFGIVQGACYQELRRQSADFLTQYDFDGFAIGGLAVGETQDQRRDFTELSCSYLPKDKPRYLMGVGTPVDLVESIYRGVDMFDCILPGAHAQQGTAFTYEGNVRMRRGAYRLDENPISKACSCHTCQNYTRAYLHHLTKAKEGLGWRLIALHNYHFYSDLMHQIRGLIRDGTFASHYNRLVNELGQFDISHPPKVEKPRSTPPPMRRGNFEVLISGVYPNERGFICDYQLKEQMHRGQNPNDEAELLYIHQTGLKTLLRQESAEKLIVWDVGMGAGHNAMAAIREIESASMQRPVEILSFENDLDSMHLASKYTKYFPHLRHAAPQRILTNGRYDGNQSSYVWQLLSGDFSETYGPASHPDIVMFDPFSSESNPRLWELQFLKNMREKVGSRGFVLSNYSSATPFRAALLAAGYWVFDGLPTTGNRPSTFAFSRFMPEHPAWIESRRLGDEWLQRWRRSSTQFPKNIDPDDHLEFSRLVEAAAQFNATASI